jgi:hypothetical protein
VYKATEISSKAKEHLYIVKGRQDWLIGHGLTALQINSDPVLSHNKAKEVYLPFMEVALR